MAKKENKVQGSCESCAYYTYDEEYEYYVCEANLDEDEMSAFLRGAEFEEENVWDVGDQYPDARSFRLQGQQ